MIPQLLTEPLTVLLTSCPDAAMKGGNDLINWGSIAESMGRIGGSSGKFAGESAGVNHFYDLPGILAKMIGRGKKGGLFRVFSVSAIP